MSSMPLNLELAWPLPAPSTVLTLVTRAPPAIVDAPPPPLPPEPPLRQSAKSAAGGGFTASAMLPPQIAQEMAAAWLV